MKKALLYLFLGLAITGCTNKDDFIIFGKTNIIHPQAKKTVSDANHLRFEYKILPHDRISITMYNHPELGTSSSQSQKQDTRGVLVNSKGFIRLPLIKSIHIAGLSQTEAQKKIEKAFGAFLEDAEVYLEVLNKRAYVLGEVTQAGKVDLLNEKITLLQLLAQVGGFKNSANKQAIVILKNRHNKIHTQTVDLTGTNSLVLANTMIYPNDVVYVAPNRMSAFNFGIGEVTPMFRLISAVTTPLANVKFLSD